MLDVRRMRVLREVAIQGSFSAAAEALSFTQSAVSQQIAALERETGTILVQRSARGVRLTEAGEALVRHADAVLCRLAEAEAELEAIAGLRGGRLRMAAFESAGATLMPPAIAAGMIDAPALGKATRRRRPPRRPAIASSSASASDSRARITSAWATSARPASVRCTPRARRSTSTVPASRSRAAICWETADCV